uniref:Uncharacterized protein n=2 Tax=Triticum urartu TaxID=4572 RepID=A0A8R7QZI1_TRIUA
MATAVASQPRHFTLGGEPRAAICAASTSKICTLDKVYGFRWLEFRRQRIAFQRTRRWVHSIP